MTWGKNAAEQGVMAWRHGTIVRCLSLIALCLAICLVLLAFPARASAHTDLLRTVPTQNAILSTSPGQVSFWFSAVVDAEFSTAIVENGAHEYVNTSDSSLAHDDGREMDVPLPTHLPPGVYTVVWRAASDSDGRILSGAYRFAIAQAGELVTKQSSHAAWPFTGQLDSLVHTLALVLMLGVVCLLYSKKKLNLRFTHAWRWQSIVSVVVLIFLGLALGMPDIVSSARTAPAMLPALQSDTQSAFTAFHAAVRTTDTRFMILLDVHINRCCASTFDMSANDASSGKPMVNVSVVLLTTMLDMPMGTDTVKMQRDGKGHFSAQSDLSMGGRWQICVLMRGADQMAHTVCVKVLIPFV